MVEDGKEFLTKDTENTFNKIIDKNSPNLDKFI